MKKLLLLLPLLLLWSVAYGGVVKTDFNPKFQSIRLDSTGTGHVVVRTASGSGDTLDLYLMPVDSCGALFIGGVGSTHNDSLYYVPCNSNDTINLLRTGSGSTDSFMVDLTDSYTADSTWITPNDTLHIDTTTSGAGVYLPLAGGTMVGDIDMAGTNLVGVDTISGNNGTNILYIFGTEGTGDGSIIIGPHGVGGADTIIFAGNASSTPYRVFYISTALDSISAENHKITMVNDPDNAQDVATKNYVDTMKIVSSDIVDRTIVSADLDTGAVARLNLDTAGSYKVADLEATDSLMTPKLVGSNRLTQINGFKGATDAILTMDTTSTFGDTVWYVVNLEDGVYDTVYLVRDSIVGGGSGSEDSLTINVSGTEYHIMSDYIKLKAGTNVTFTRADSTSFDDITIDASGAGTSDTLIFNVSGTEYDIVNDRIKVKAGSNVTFSRDDSANYDVVTVSATGGGDTTSKVLYNPGTIADSLKIIGDTLSFDTDNDTAWIDAPNDFLVVKADQIGDGSLYTLDTLGLYPNDSAVRNLGRDTLPFATIYALGVGDTSTYGNIDLYGKLRYRVDTGSGTMLMPFHDSTSGEPGADYVYAWDATDNRFEIKAQTGGAGEANTASNLGTSADSIFYQKSSVDLQFKRLKDSTGVTITPSGDTALAFSYDAGLIVDTAELHDSLTNYSTTSAIETLIADSLDEYSVTTAIEALIADSLDEYSVTTAIEALIADSLDEYSLTTAIATTYLERAAFDDSVAHYSMVDSIGVDVDGGAIDTWHKAAFGLREGSNITFSMLGDTLTIAGGAGGAFVASADTAGTGSNIVTSGDSIRIKQGSGIDLSATTWGDGYILQIDATGSGYWTHTTPGAGDTSLIWAEPATDTFIQFKVDPTNDTVWVLANDGDNDKYLIFGADQVGTSTPIITVGTDSVAVDSAMSAGRFSTDSLTLGEGWIAQADGAGLQIQSGVLNIIGDSTISVTGDSVRSLKIQDGAVSGTGKIVADAVQEPDLYVVSGAATDNYVLTSDGGTGFTWDANTGTGSVVRNTDPSFGVVLDIDSVGIDTLDVKVRFRFPQSTTPIIGIAGEFEWDTDDEQLVTENGATTEFAIAQSEKVMQMSIDDPANLVRDTIIMFYCDASTYPAGITIIELGLAMTTSGNDTCIFAEYTAPNTRSGFTQTIGTNSNYAAATASLTHVLDAGNYLMVEVDRLDIASNSVQVYGVFRVNRN